MTAARSCFSLGEVAPRPKALLASPRAKGANFSDPMCGGGEGGAQWAAPAVAKAATAELTAEVTAAVAAVTLKGTVQSEKQLMDKGSTVEELRQMRAFVYYCLNYFLGHKCSLAT